MKKRFYKVNKKNPEVRWALFLLKSYGLSYSFHKPIANWVDATYNPWTHSVKFHRKFRNLDDFLSALFHELCHHICAHEGIYSMCYRPDFTTKKGRALFKQNYFKMEFYTDNLAEEMMGFYFPNRAYHRSYFNNKETKNKCLTQATEIINHEITMQAAIKFIKKWQEKETLLSY